MDENQTPDTATESHEGVDATEAPAEPTTPKFHIDLFQTSRIHTERFTEEFDTREQAEAFAREQCADKGIDEDFEISEAKDEPEVALTPADIEAAEAEAAYDPANPQLPVEATAEPEKVEAPSENSPEGSDEKTTQNNSLPLN